jgi:hypothetical protein
MMLKPRSSSSSSSDRLIVVMYLEECHQYCVLCLKNNEERTLLYVYLWDMKKTELCYASYVLI